MNKLKQILISITILILILTGCTDRRLLSYEEYIGLLDSGITVSSDNLSVASKGEVSLGDINVGSPKTITFTIKSTGESPLKITDLDLKGDSGFSLSGSGSKELAKGKTMTFSVTYSPSAIENGSSAVLTIKNNSPTSKYTITFKANGIPAGQTARPVFSIDSGSYTETQVLTLSCTTANSHIRYTTDGTAPSDTAGTLYTGAIMLSTSVTIKAIAYSDNVGSTPSLIIEKTYTFSYAPVMTLSVVEDNVNVASNGIYDFGEQNVNSLPITKQFKITNEGNMSLTLGNLEVTGDNVFSVETGLSKTNVPSTGGTATFTIKLDRSAIGSYSGKISITNNSAKNPYVVNIKGKVIPTGTCAAPTITVKDKLDGTKEITMSSSTSGSSIHYTTNGDTPTANSTKYTIPIPISTTTTIKAICIKDGYNDSSVVTQTITFNVYTFYKVDYDINGNSTPSPISDEKYDYGASSAIIKKKSYFSIENTSSETFNLNNLKVKSFSNKGTFTIEGNTGDIAPSNTVVFSIYYTPSSWQAQDDYAYLTIGSQAVKLTGRAYGNLTLGTTSITFLQNNLPYQLLSAPSSICCDGDYLYVGNSAYSTSNPSLVKISISNPNDCQIFAKPDGSPAIPAIQFITTDGEYIYCIENVNNQKIHKFKNDGTYVGYIKLPYSNSGQTTMKALGIAYYKNALYIPVNYSLASTNDSFNGIAKIDLSGSTECFDNQDISSFTSSSTPMSRYVNIRNESDLLSNNNIIVFGDSLFYGDNNIMYVIDINSKNIIEKPCNYLSVTNKMIADKNNLYIFTDQTIYKYDSDMNTFDPITPPGGLYATAVTTDGKNIYYAISDKTAIYKLNN